VVIAPHVGGLEVFHSKCGLFSVRVLAGPYGLELGVRRKIRSPPSGGDSKNFRKIAGGEGPLLVVCSKWVAKLE